MKNALIVACVVVTALSMLMCEISPSSAIWRIVSAQQQQEVSTGFSQRLTNKA